MYSDWVQTVFKILMNTDTDMIQIIQTIQIVPRLDGDRIQTVFNLDSNGIQSAFKLDSNRIQTDPDSR